MKITKNAITLGLLGLISMICGCASVSKQPTNIYPEVREDKGLVYFYRERKFVGAAISYNIKENGEIVGAIANGTYFFLFVDPGTHTYTAATEASTSRTLEVEAGKTYYVECGVEMGFMAGHPSMRIVNDAEGKSVLPNLKYAIK